MAKPEGLESDRKEADPVSNIEDLKIALYTRCLQEGPGAMFNQEALLALGIIPLNDIHQLFEITKQLQDENLFRMKKNDLGLYWTAESKENAAAEASLSRDERWVFHAVRSSGREGLWVRAIRDKTKLAVSSVNKALKTLRSKKMVKEVVSARNPGRKTYMLYSLSPSENVTGGVLFTDGNLDEELIRQLSNFIERYVIGRSWWHPRKKPKSGAAQLEGLHAEEPRKKEWGRARSKAMLPMPPGYTGYPTAAEVTKAVNSFELTTVPIGEAEIRQILNVLRWDGRLESAINGKGYRAVRNEGMADNGLTESPCGRCPVLDFCEEGGPVNARSCEYFQHWLEL